MLYNVIDYSVYRVSTQSLGIKTTRKLAAISVDLSKESLSNSFAQAQQHGGNDVTYKTVSVAKPARHLFMQMQTFLCF